tara:strand:- start:177 stop:452 length:276 start_codon:yes stop_codon:yes gene_type:complete
MVIERTVEGSGMSIRQWEVGRGIPIAETGHVRVKPEERCREVRRNTTTLQVSNQSCFVFAEGQQDDLTRREDIPDTHRKTLHNVFRGAFQH